MLLTGRTPFGLAWAEAARTAVEVVTVDVLSRRAAAPGPDPQLVVPRLRLRPKRLTAPLTDRLVERRVETALRAIQSTRGPVDLLHSHFYPAGRYLVGPARRLGIPHVHTEHSTTLTPQAAEHKRLTAAGRRVAARVLGSATATVTVSTYLRDCLVELGLVEDAVVIGNPVAVDLFRPEARPGPPTGRLVSVGRLEADKRPLLLVEAFALARAQLPHLTLELIGDGPLRDDVRTHAERLDVSDAVTLAGQLPPVEVARRVGAADAYVTATQVETFGVAIAEAIAAGTPVAAFSNTAVPELVDDHVGRLADESGGPTSLAGAIIDVVQHAADFDRLAMAAHLRNRFGPEVIGQRLAELYEQVRGHGTVVTRSPR